MSYQDVKDRLYHGHRVIANNTKLRLVPGHEYSTEQIEMRLHGNLIARFNPQYFELYSTGWYSPTTKDRLNLALKLAHIARQEDAVPGISWYYRKIYQVDWQWYYGNYHKSDPRFHDGMKVNYSGNIIL